MPDFHTHRKQKEAHRKRNNRNCRILVTSFSVLSVRLVGLHIGTDKRIQHQEKDALDSVLRASQESARAAA